MKDYNSNDYIINENYHGDIKVIRQQSKKVDLSKPTDILSHRSTSEIMPTIYANNNPPQKINHKINKRVCLTKPQDIIENEKKSIKAEMLFNQVLQQERLKNEHKKNIQKKLIGIIVIIFAVIPIISYATNDGLDVNSTIIFLLMFMISLNKLTKK